MNCSLRGWNWNWNYPVLLSPRCCPKAKFTPSLWLLGELGSSERKPPATLHMQSRLAGLPTSCRKAPLLLQTTVYTQFYRISVPIL